MIDRGLKLMRAGVAMVILAFFFGLTADAPAQTNTADATAGTASAEPAVSQETLRSYLQIQEQLHSAQTAIERNRQDAEAASARNAELLQASLSLIEKSLNTQRMEQLQDVQRSNRLMLIAAGVFAVVGMLVLLFTAFMHWNSVSRLATVASALPAGLGMGEGSLASAGLLKDSTARFIGSIERLEKRIQDMELTLKGQHALPQPMAIQTNGHDHSEPAMDLIAKTAESSTAPSSETEMINMLLGKGETLLKLDQADGALACFEEALSIDSANAEALVRKGLALERLQRWEEAIACYDRAIAVDQLMTMAYLYKGGIFNRLGRYSDALECYERALRTQDKGHSISAKVVVE